MSIYTLRLVGTKINLQIGSRMLSFCWPLWVGAIAGLFIGSANRYFIRAAGSLEEVGLFELAAKFGAIVTLLVWTPFAQYWSVARFEIFKQEDAIIIYQTVFRFICLLMVLAALGISIFSEPVIYIMASSEFLDAKLAVPFLAYAAVFGCLTIFFNFSFLIKESTKWISLISYLTAAIVSVFYFFLIPKIGFVGAAQSLMLACMAQFFITFFITFFYSRFYLTIFHNKYI